jgi:hypothetical protein
VSGPAIRLGEFTAARGAAWRPRFLRYHQSRSLRGGIRRG